MPPTTKDELMQAVDKLVADVNAQSQAHADKTAADGAVNASLQAQATAAANHNAAQAQVQQDLAELKLAADNLADEDDAT